MIEQRQNDLLPTDFETSGGDTQEIGLQQFEMQ